MRKTLHIFLTAESSPEIFKKFPRATICKFREVSIFFKFLGSHNKGCEILAPIQIQWYDPFLKIIDI